MQIFLTMLVICITQNISVSAIASLLEGPLIFASFDLNGSLTLFSNAN